MTAAPQPALALPARVRRPPRRRGGRAGRVALIGGTVAFLTLFIVLPVANVFTQAFSKGIPAYVQVFAPPALPPQPTLADKRKGAAARGQAERTWGAITMSLGIAAVVVPLNVLFGLAAAWALTKFRFPGRALATALIDLPFSVSPVVAGLALVLLFGRNGVFGAAATSFVWPDPATLTWRGFADGPWPIGFDGTLQGVIFTPLAIALASTFVTFPFVARALIPLMAAQGTDEEVAARSLGAGGLRTFLTVTLPNIRWALLYGVTLCTARALGEFGAVSVVSGATDRNDTMPLRVEKLWNEYNNQAAFTVASLLALLAVVTLVIKAVADLRSAGGVAPTAGSGGRGEGR